MKMVNIQEKFDMIYEKYFDNFDEQPKEIQFMIHVYSYYIGIKEAEKNNILEIARDLREEEELPPVSDEELEKILFI